MLSQTVWSYSQIREGTTSQWALSCSSLVLECLCTTALGNTLCTSYAPERRGAWSLKPEARLTSGNQHQTSPSLSPQKGGLGPELLPHIHPHISLEVPSGSLSSRMADPAGHGEKETSSSQGLPSQFYGNVFKYLEAKWWTYKIKMIRGFFSYVSWPRHLSKDTISSNLAGHLLRVLVTMWWQSTLRYQRSLPFDAEGIPRSATVPACSVLVK